MRLVNYSLFICILITPQLAVSEQQEQYKYTDREEIAFKLSSEAAFDRSGKRISSSVQPDGSILAEHNGSLGNITVARLGADGKVETFCTTDANAARSWMAGADATGPDTTLNTLLEEK